MRRLAALGLGLALLAWPTLVLAHGACHEQRLPTIGRAPDFALTSQDGATVALRDFRAGSSPLHSSTPPAPTSARC